VTAWRTLAQVVIDPLPADWREQLAVRLGERPRRIGPWAELALYGARLCLDAAHEPVLPASCQLRLASQSGPLSATRAIIGQARNHLPQPFAFMQSQPSHALAVLSQHLAWQGDARFMLCHDVPALLLMAQHECEEQGSTGLLLGQVEEGRRSAWWRLQRD
jgi:hypothetical protein